MSWGLLVKNKSGNVLIDGEHPIPKLMFEGEIKATEDAGYLEWKGSLSFPPLEGRAFATVAPLETKSPSGGFSGLSLGKNSDEKYSRITVYSVTLNSSFHIWVYEL